MRGREKELPMIRLWYNGRPSCCDASPALPKRGSSSPTTPPTAVSGIPVADAML